MKSSRVLFLSAAFLFLPLQLAAAEDLKTFCSQTCGLWPKLCASATVCSNLCKTPQRLMKACRNNKVPVDTKLPAVTYTKQQFCQHICPYETLRCSVATYCIQTCKTPAHIIDQCLKGGDRVDSERPQLQG